MVSIKDVAKRCGVSVATVSKALNDCSDISSATKLRVKRIADEMGYFPNLQAKALKTSKTKTIGIIYSNRLGNGLKQVYFSSIIESFKSAIEEDGYDLIFIGSRMSEEKKYTYYEHCKHRNVDGVLVACSDFYDSSICQLLRSELPVVVIDFFSKRDYSVCSDNRQGMRDILEYVYDMGHRKIGYIYGDTSQITTVRLDTFTETMKQLGVPVVFDYVKQGRYNDIRLAQKLTDDMLSLYDPPTCIIMPDDVSALGSFIAARDRNLRIPDDLSVVGYDGISFTQISGPGLTTVYQDTDEMGKRAAELLLSRIRGEEISEVRMHTMVETQLIKGHTVKKMTI